MKTRSELKTMNWQDVTMEQLLKHWEGMEELKGFELAAYQNAHAYGDLAGDGIDVRCKYADEVVERYRDILKIDKLVSSLQAIGWKLIKESICLVMMQKDTDIVKFDVDNGDAAYITMTITNEYADECCDNFEYYYDEQKIATILFGREYIVNERNIICLFQRVCRKYIDYTEDAGGGLCNTNIDDIIIRVYPNDEYHKVFVLSGNSETRVCINDLPFNEQVEYLKMYCDYFMNHCTSDTDKKKIKLAERFITYCKERGAVLYRDEYCGNNDTEREIVYCTKSGIVYQYFDNNGDGMPTIQTIAYPIPSNLRGCGIIKYLIEECLSYDKYNEIKELADFLSLSDDEQNKQGVPHEYFYGWVWEDGSFDKSAEYEDLKIMSDKEIQTEKDCEYLVSIYPMLKDGNHADKFGSLHTDCTTEEMVGNAAQFCTYFKESGLSLNDFLAQYNDLSRDNSLWNKCDEFAHYLISTYVGKDEDMLMQRELQNIIHEFVMKQAGASYFPKK